MPGAKTSAKSPVEAVQVVYEALEPYDDATRQRIVASAASLLGMRVPTTSPAQTPPALPEGKQHPSPREAATGRPLSPIELIQEKQPATNAQKIALFAYYREKVEGHSRFSRDDLKPYFAKAKESPPTNYDRDFREAVKQGWIYEDGEESYLTSKGLEAVAAGFAGKALPRGKAASPEKRRNRRKRKTMGGKRKQRSRS